MDTDTSIWSDFVTLYIYGFALVSASHGLQACTVHQHGTELVGEHAKKAAT